MKHEIWYLKSKYYAWFMSRNAPSSVFSKFDPYFQVMTDRIGVKGNCLLVTPVSPDVVSWLYIRKLLLGINCRFNDLSLVKSKGLLIKYLEILFTFWY